MTLTRWDPYRELEDMSNRLQRFFGRSAMGRTATTQTEGGREEAMTFSEWYPAVDIEEDNEAFHIKAELPAIEKKDLRVDVSNGVLTIAGERRREKEEKGKRYHRVERSYGQFMRSFTLPDNVDEEHVMAQFKDGVLDVRVPKTEKAKAKTRAVEIR